MHLLSKKKERGHGCGIIHQKSFRYANTTTFPLNAPFLGDPKAKETQSFQSLTGGMGHFLK
jgi:hypothetical protein